MYMSLPDAAAFNTISPSRPASSSAHQKKRPHHSSPATSYRGVAVDRTSSGKAKRARWDVTVSSHRRAIVHYCNCPTSLKTYSAAPPPSFSPQCHPLRSSPCPSHTRIIRGRSRSRRPHRNSSSAWTARRRRTRCCTRRRRSTRITRSVATNNNIIIITSARRSALERTPLRNIMRSSVRRRRISMRGRRTLSGARWPWIVFGGARSTRARSSSSGCGSGSGPTRRATMDIIISASTPDRRRPRRRPPRPRR